MDTTIAAPARTREIGFTMAVALVMGNMIGSGVFLLPASLAPFGGISLVGWIVSAGGSICLALVFARLSRYNPAAGGPYAFTRQGFGDLAGFLVAWGYWISCWCTTAALAVAFVGYLDPFFPALVRSPVSAALVAVATMWVLTAVNIAGVRTAAQVQLVTTILKILPLAVVGFAGVAWFDASRFAIAPAAPAVFGGQVSQAATLTLWAFLGLECATIAAGTIRDADRTVPRATLVGTALSAAIYIVATVGVMSVVAPASLATSTAPFADAARAMFGEGAARAIALGAAISCFGALNGWVLIAGQLPLAAAEDRLFPGVFRRVSTRGTPAIGMIIAGVLATILIALNSSRDLVSLFTFIILLATLSTLVPYTFCSLAGFILERRDSRFRSTPGSRAIAALAFLYSIWAIGGAGAETVYWGFLLLMAGLPVYVWVVRR